MATFLRPNYILKGEMYRTKNNFTLPNNITDTSEFVYDNVSLEIVRVTKWRTQMCVRLSVSLSYVTVYISFIDFHNIWSRPLIGM